MMHSKIRHSLLAAAVAALIAPVGVSYAQDAGPGSDANEERSSRFQSRSRSRAENAPRNTRADKAAPAAAVQYPDATRPAPTARASAKLSPRLQKMVKALDDDKHADARAQADEIIALPTANEYERAFAAQIGLQAALNADDNAAAIAYAKQIVDANGMDNNSHYGAMLTLAQLQLQEDKFAESVATFDRFFNEAKSNKPEHLMLKGNALYRLERYPEAITVMKQAVDASPEPRVDWMQLLMGAYIEAEQPAEAMKLAEAVAARSPNDKRAQMNLAVVYMQNDANDKAVAVLEKMRAAGQLTDEKDYRNLYATYYNMDGKQAQVISVINEGLQKGILKPDYQNHIALAQAYYDSDQIGPAIENFRKAAPLAADGQTYLNLANLLWGENRIPEAKDAARQALAKGVKKPEDARKIIALPGK